MTSIKDKIYQRVLLLLKFRPRSEKEIRNFVQGILKKYKIPLSEHESLINETISYLKEINLIDDNEFIKYWVAKRSGRNPKGRKIIIYELRQKGIDNDFIENNLKIIFENYDQNEIIKKTLNKADRRYIHLDPLNRRKKLTQYLLRRGFNYNEFNHLVDEIVKKQ